MNFSRKIVDKLLIGSILFLPSASIFAAVSKNEARVTRVVHDVKLLEPKADARPATINDKVVDDTAVRTGDESRSELTFVDLRITRLGSNTIFSFNKAGHNVQLNTGSLLLYVPKDSGGGQMTTAGVSVAITGTTVTFRATRLGRTQLTVLEGRARAWLRKYPNEAVEVQAGQMIDVPAGATKMPQPTNINVKDAMKTPLITDFPPLPSAPLIGTSGPAAAPPAPSNPWQNYPTHTRPGAPYFPPKNPPKGGGGGTTVGTTQPTNPTNPVGTGTGAGGGNDGQPPPGKPPGTGKPPTVGTQPTNPGTGTVGGGTKTPPGKAPVGTVGTKQPPKTGGGNTGGSTPTLPPRLGTVAGNPAGNTTGTTTTGGGGTQVIPRKVAGRGPGSVSTGTSAANQKMQAQPRKRRSGKKR